MDGNYNESIKTLQEAIKIEPRYLEAFLSIAGLYFEQKNYQGAIENYEKSKAIDSSWFKDYNLPYSINLAAKGEFKKALQAVDQFLSIPNLNEQSLKAADYRRKTYQFAIDYNNQHPAAVIILNRKTWAIASTACIWNISQRSPSMIRNSFLHAG